MKTHPTRTFDTLADSMTDPLERYRSFARRALATPETDFTAVQFEESENFEPEVAVAFARVAQYLADVAIPDRALNVERGAAVDFLTNPGPPHTGPITDTEEGQLVRLHRDRDGRVSAVLVMRSDTKAVTSTDMRFPFRVVKDFDAEVRIKAAWVNQFNLEHSAQPGVRARAELSQKQLDAMTGDERLQMAADIYREAKAVGARPRKLIADRMFVSENYAGVLISRARDKGYLPTVKEEAKGNL